MGATGTDFAAFLVGSLIVSVVQPSLSANRSLVVREPHSLSPAALIAVSSIEFLLLGGAILVSLIGIVQDVDVSPWVTVVAPFLLVAAMAWGCIHAIRTDRVNAWAPLLWWRLAMMAYSGVGSLLPYFGTPETRGYVDAFFQTFPLDVVKYNLVSAVFALVVLIVVRVIAAPRTRRTAQSWTLGVERSALSTVEFGVLAILAALPIRFFNSILPLATGQPSILPNAVSLLEMLSSVGCALLIAHYLEQRSKKLWLVIALVAAEAFLGLMVFAKVSFLLPIVMASLGALYQNPTMRRVLFLGGVVTILYMTSTPLVSYGRAMDATESGSIQPTFGRSIGHLTSYRPGIDTTAETENVQYSWSRIAYYNAGSFAINQYDRGIPGNTLRDIDVVLIPRILYPDKPEITEISREFNVMATGNDQSFSNPGIPSEGYWIAGWWGVIGYAIAMGFVYCVWSIYAIRVVHTQAWHLLFVVLLGVRVATRIDGMFVSDFFPMVFYAIAAHFAASFANRLITRRAVFGVGGRMRTPHARSTG